MYRELEYTITEADANRTVKEYLHQKHYSAQNLITLKNAENSVLKNNTPVFMKEHLQAGDKLTIRIIENNFSQNIIPVELPLSIVYEDEDLMVMNKPAGMPIHPSMNHHDNSLANGLAWYFTQKQTPFIFRCITRLDRDTSGLALIAKHAVSAAILSAQIANKASGELCREYLAITEGHVNPPSGTINAPLGRKDSSIIERTIDFEKGEHAVTHYQVLQETADCSLVHLVLETGRTHQIRVHMKYLGFPLLGDYLYNPDMRLIHRQALHAYRLTFTHPITGQRMQFEAPLPKDMASIVSM